MIGRFDFIVWRRESGRNLLNSSLRLICQHKRAHFTRGTRWDSFLRLQVVQCSTACDRPQNHPGCKEQGCRPDICCAVSVGQKTGTLRPEVMRAG
ncbi:hypothetical protein GJAV_G00198280 [Gymnothorax javanicus]|nr:hypothetical protein GJAV_G00198280 [Gymnothorax javanicus]